MQLKPAAGGSGDKPVSLVDLLSSSGLQSELPCESGMRSSEMQYVENYGAVSAALLGLATGRRIPVDLIRDNPRDYRA